MKKKVELRQIEGKKVEEDEEVEGEARRTERKIKGYNERRRDIMRPL